MRALLVIAVVVLVLALIGWIRFSRSPGQSSIHLEEQKVRQDTQEVLEAGEDLWDRASRQTDDERTDEPREVEPAPPATR